MEFHIERYIYLEDITMSLNHWHRNAIKKSHHYG